MGAATSLAVAPRTLLQLTLPLMESKQAMATDSVISAAAGKSLEEAHKRKIGGVPLLGLKPIVKA